jgi:AcrR family transcriptional regulator
MEVQVHTVADHDTRDKIFRSAARLFADRGYNGVSVREISELSGVSKPMIYYYFGSKEGIYSELLKTGRDFASENLQAILACDLPLRDKLVELFKARFAMCHRHPEYVRFYLSALLSSDDLPFTKMMTSDILHPQTLLKQMIQNGINSGEMSCRINANIVAAMIAGVQFVYIWQNLNLNEPVLDDHLAEEIVNHLLHGMI